MIGRGSTICLHEADSSMTGTRLKNVGAYLPSEALDRITDRLDSLPTRWKSHVSEPLASHSYPVNYADGRLSVRADTPVWASRLRQSQQEIMNQLRNDSFFTDLRELQVRVLPERSGVSMSGEIGEPRPPSRIPEHAAQLIKSVADGITDPALRNSLARLASASGRHTPQKK